MSLKYYECPICLETITHQDYYILSDCLHKYHITCLTDWYKKQPYVLKTLQCPECQLSNTQLIPVEISRKQTKKDKQAPLYKRPKKRVMKLCCIQ